MRSRMEEMRRYTPAHRLYEIGLDYLNGTALVNEKEVKDKLVAVEFFQAAADEGCPEALHMLKELGEM